MYTIHNLVDLKTNVFKVKSFIYQEFVWSQQLLNNCLHMNGQYALVFTEVNFWTFICHVEIHVHLWKHTIKLCAFIRILTHVKFVNIQNKVLLVKWKNNLRLYEAAVEIVEIAFTKYFNKRKCIFWFYVSYNKYRANNGPVAYRFIDK